MRRRIFAFSLCLLLVGCASVQLNPEQKDSVARQTKEVFGENADYNILLYPSRGGLADSVFIAQSVSQGPSSDARELAQMFAAAKEKETIIVIAGPNTAKNAQIVKDAFRLQGAASLPNLKLLFFGSSEQGAQIEKLAHKYGVTYYYREKQ